jgi:hypothetical protein
MKPETPSSVATPLAAGGGPASGGRVAVRAHERRMSGLPNLGFVSCVHCHQRSLDTLPWAKPRPHHDAPGGIAVSPDGKTLFIALDDRDEVAEADVASLSVTGGRRSRAGRSAWRWMRRANGCLWPAGTGPGRGARHARPQGTGRHLGGHSPDRRRVLPDAGGERLIVPNSGSDDISVLSVSPLLELTRTAAGREPYAVAVSGDGGRASTSPTEWRCTTRSSASPPPR